MKSLTSRFPRTLGYTIEAQILDVDNWVAAVGGIISLDPGPYPGRIDSTGKVSPPGFEPENLNQLLSGVVYGGPYNKMSFTGNTTPTTAPSFFAALVNAWNQPQGAMKIVVVTRSQLTGNHPLEIWMGASTTTLVKTYSDVVSLPNLSAPELQSHWSSGVRFTSMKVS